jgi:hypothetical protein
LDEYSKVDIIFVIGSDWVLLGELVAPSFPYPFLPLQDCVDLSIFLVRATMEIQAWTVDVRGAVDVATITKTNRFRPVQLKQVTGEKHLVRKRKIDMDLTTNTAGTEAWLRATQGVTFLATDVSLYQTTGCAATSKEIDPGVSTPDSSVAPVSQA